MDFVDPVNTPIAFNSRSTRSTLSILSALREVVTG